MSSQHDYYKESEFNGKWIPMSKKEIIELCDDYIKDNRIKDLKIKEQIEENEKLKEEHNTFNEIWKTEGITEQEIIDLKRGHVEKSNLIKELKDKLEKSMEVWKFYWSGGLLGEDHTNELRPKSWQKELAEAQGEDYSDSDEEEED